jgi:hypothetical protein
MAESNLQTTLLNLATSRMTPKEMLRATLKVHPRASKKDIVHAAFASLIAVADKDVDTARVLQNFAIAERGD